MQLLLFLRALGVILYIVNEIPCHSMENLS